MLLLEREDQPGYHSTGRSAAMLTETYGTAAVRALARASRPFFERPPAGFTDLPLLQPRGMLHVARPDQLASLDAAARSARPLLPAVRTLAAAEVVDHAPLVERSYVAGGLLEPDAMAIDVAALHQGYLRGFRRRGGRLVCGAGITAIERTASGYSLETAAGRFEAALFVNAAGAWADELARRAEVEPIGLVPTRRTALLIEPPDGLDPASWPMVIDVDEQFYVKPEGGQLLLSPADETPVEPSDVQPDELDIAVAVERYRQLCSRCVPRIGRRWAGLRSFVADHAPVIGADPIDPGFIWLAALGGFGIMTAPAADEELSSLCEMTSPARLRRPDSR